MRQGSPNLCPACTLVQKFNSSLTSVPFSHARFLLESNQKHHHHHHGAQMILRNCSGRHFLQAMKSLQYLLCSISPRFPMMLRPRYYKQTLPLCQNCAFKLSLIWESFVPEESFWRRRGNSLCNVSSHQEPLTSTSNSFWQQFLLLLH